MDLTMDVKLTALLLLLILPTFKTADVLNSKEILRRTLPVYGLAETSLRIFNGSKLELDPESCLRKLELFLRAVDDRTLWALKMLDASGVPKPGFVYGNNFWFGVRSQCLDLQNRYPMPLNAEVMKNNSLYRDVHKEFPPFELNYFVAYFRHNSTLQYHIRWKNEDLMSLGLCLPASCTINELGVTLKAMFQERTLVFGDLYSADLQLVQVKDLKDDHRWLLSANIIIIILVIALFVLLVIAGTSYEIFFREKYINPCHLRKEGSKEMNQICENNKVEPITDDSEAVEAAKASESRAMKEGLWGRMLICFSAYKNTRIIFGTKLSSNTVKPIHGLRFLGMIWIFFLHPVYFMFDYNDNNVWIWKISEDFALQIISNGSISVDSYFFISGFLVAYIFYTRREKGGEKASCRDNLSSIFHALLQRFMRLTPAYMMALGIVQLNGAWYGKTSQFWMNERPQEECAKYWWRNLLYINNLFGRHYGKTNLLLHYLFIMDESMIILKLQFQRISYFKCMAWSWYLSNDMQFFIIAFSLLTLSTVYFYLAVMLLLSLICFSIGITGYIVYINNYIPTLDEQYHKMHELYDPPWTRITPYLVGMVTAYIITRLNGKLSMHRKWVIVCWTLGSLCNLIVIFGIYEKQISLTKSIMYVSLSRTAWGLGLAWLLIACCTRHGGIVNKILCFKIWIPLSRLTYCAYLLNPFIISSVYLQRESSTHMNIIPSGVLFMGFIMANYLSAYVLSLMVELPIVHLMHIFNGGKRR